MWFDRIWFGLVLVRFWSPVGADRRGAVQGGAGTRSVSSSTWRTWMGELDLAMVGGSDFELGCLFVGVPGVCLSRSARRKDRAEDGKHGGPSSLQISTLCLWQLCSAVCF